MARDAFEDGRWSRLHPRGRREALIHLAKLISRNARELTVMASLDSFDEAIALANDTEYGLAASIFISNVKKALRGARAIRAGKVTVNSIGEGDISTPFGDFKASGFGGRDNGIHAHDQYTQIKAIWVDLADDVDGAVAWQATARKERRFTLDQLLGLKFCRGRSLR